jgi:adenine/guanine phosphoribosyltransferase-like PRPP-binding protein
MPSPTGPACCSTTTCSPPAAPARATAEAIERLGGEVVRCASLVELAFLGGRERLARRDVRSLISYDS